jgi:myo-inositol-1(or 4)-monophosphatase
VLIPISCGSHLHETKMSTFSNHLHLGRRIAKEAGEILIKYFGNASVSQKSSQNLVTEANLASEKSITESIQREFPNHLFLCEEGQSTAKGPEEDVWIIDPLDATNNYAHGIPHFSVSIAYAKHGIPQVGIIWDPIRKEEFYAVAGEGAFLNENQIRTSNRKELTESIIATGFYYDRGALMERTLDGIRALFHKNIRGIRRTGGAALDLSWVACGRFEGFFEYELAPWDYAAGALIVSEAGGICSNREGGQLNLASRNIIAANPHIHSHSLTFTKDG